MSEQAWLMKDLLQNRKIQGWIHDVESRDIVLVAEKPTRVVCVFFALTVFFPFLRLYDSMKVCTKQFFFLVRDQSEQFRASKMCLSRSLG